MLYVDESGSTEDPTKHFVVAGIAVHEVDLRRLHREVDAIVALHLDEHLRGIELHANRIRGGSGPWRPIPPAVKNGLLDDLATLLGSFEPTHPRGFSILAVVLEPSGIPEADPIERVFEDLLLRFTKLTMKFSKVNDRDEYGLSVLDDSKYEAVLQAIARQWQEHGTRFGQFTRMTRLVEVPLFTDSSASRFIQLADLAAYFVYRGYQENDWRRFEMMLPRFDTSDDGLLHGLLHINEGFKTCECAACSSKRTQVEARNARREQRNARGGRGDVGNDPAQEH